MKIPKKIDTYQLLASANEFERNIAAAKNNLLALKWCGITSEELKQAIEKLDRLFELSFNLKEEIHDRVRNETTYP